MTVISATGVSSTLTVKGVVVSPSVTLAGPTSETVAVSPGASSLMVVVTEALAAEAAMFSKPPPVMASIAMTMSSAPSASGSSMVAIVNRVEVWPARIVRRGDSGEVGAVGGRTAVGQRDGDIGNRCFINADREGCGRVAFGDAGRSDQ